MGGKAFTSGPTPLSTRRMPPDTYRRLRDHYLHILRSLYNEVATPIEAPAKVSYGDIDILVSQPSDLSNPPTTDVLSKTLNADRVLGTSFAVSYPDQADQHVQIDVHVCPLGTFAWHFFHQFHGDLWNLLGTTIRPFDLTANDVGFHIRIPEIEDLNRKRAFVLLTSEPSEVLEFWAWMLKSMRSRSKA